MWLILALATALFTSFQDVCGKRIINKVDVHVVAWGWIFFSLPLTYAWLAVEGIPPLGPSFLKALAISTILLIFASVLYFKAIKYSDLSISMPMLTLTPLMLLITSPLILGEKAGPWGMLGVVSIVVGAYVLGIREKRKGFFAPFRFLIKEKGPRYMLIVAALYSIGANYDKVGVVNSSPIMWIAALNTVLTVALGVLMIWKAERPVRQIRSVWPALVFIGTFNALALIAQMAAIEMTLVPYLIAVKRTSALITSLFGFWLFKEEGMKERLTGAALMVTGVLIITFFQ